MPPTNPHPLTPLQSHTHTKGRGGPGRPRFFFALRGQILRKSFSRFEKSVLQMNDFSDYNVDVNFKFPLSIDAEMLFVNTFYSKCLGFLESNKRDLLVCTNFLECHNFHKTSDDSSAPVRRSYFCSQFHRHFIKSHFTS
jgi:hypothetical protein